MKYNVRTSETVRQLTLTVSDDVHIDDIERTIIDTLAIYKKKEDGPMVELRFTIKDTRKCNITL